jgi:hypothetical protein
MEEMKYKIIYRYTAVHVFRQLVLEEVEGGVGGRINSRDLRN